MTDEEHRTQRRAGLRTTRMEAFMVVSFLPFPTRLLAEHIREDEAERVAATVYGLNLMLASALVGALWRYAIREGLVRPDASDRDVAMLSRRLVPSLAGYVVVIVLGLFLPVLAVVGYLAIAIYIIVPFRAIRPSGLGARRSTRKP